MKKQLDDGTLKEKWVVCEEYPNYEVSNAQRVRNVRTLKFKSPCKKSPGSGFRRNPKEYISFRLYVCGKYKSVGLHRLMCWAFNDRPPAWMKDPVVDHIDAEEIYDNRPENLRWMERGENTARGYEKPVIATKLDGSTVPFESLHDAAKKLGLGANHICDVLKGRHRTHHGYAFEYAE